MTSETLVEYRQHGPVAVLTLVAPPANTYSHAMMLQLDTQILRARFDPTVHAIVLTGAGEKFFCAGADIAMLNDADPTFKYYFCLHANETLSRLEQTPKLVIAALNGHCVGGGLEVAMACDMRIGRRGAGKVGLPEVKLGVLPGTGGTQRLARLLGKSAALALMLHGDNMSFDDALARGIIDRVLDAPAESFLDEIVAYATSLCAPAAASLAIGHIKRAVQTGAEIPLEYGLALERELQAKLFASADAREGIAAFGEKRKPVFRGE